MKTDCKSQGHRVTNACIVYPFFVIIPNQELRPKNSVKALSIVHVGPPLFKYPYNF